jgi:hypothetical protein
MRYLFLSDKVSGKSDATHGPLTDRFAKLPISQSPSIVRRFCVRRRHRVVQCGGLVGGIVLGGNVTISSLEVIGADEGGGERTEGVTGERVSRGWHASPLAGSVSDGTL